MHRVELDHSLEVLQCTRIISFGQGHQSQMVKGLGTAGLLLQDPGKLGPGLRLSVEAKQSLGQTQPKIR